MAKDKRISIEQFAVDNGITVEECSQLVYRGNYATVQILGATYLLLDESNQPVKDSEAPPELNESTPETKNGDQIPDSKNTPPTSGVSKVEAAEPEAGTHKESGWGLYILIGIIVIAALAAVSDGLPGSRSSSGYIGGQFNSMSSCLSAVRNEIGRSLTPIRNKPSVVSGDDGRFWACTRQESGTRGVYYQADVQAK